MRVHVLGDAFCDIVAHGLKTLPSWGGDAKSDGIALFAGGSALNTAVHIKGLLDGDEHTVTLFTALGEKEDDWASKMLENHLRTSKVGLSMKRIKGKDTGVCIVMSAKVDRAFVTCNGAISDYALHHIDVLKLADCDHLHFGGLYALTSLINDLPMLCRQVRECNPKLTISMDTNFDASGNWGKPWLSQMLPYVDIIKLNEEEAIGVRDMNSATPTDMQAVSWLASKVRITGIVTKGKEGAVFATSKQYSEMHDIPSVPVTARDAVGAGDAFNAGFIAHWLAAGRTEAAIRDAVHFACKCGALNITVLGACQTPVTYARVAEIESETSETSELKRAKLSEESSSF